MGIIVIVYHVYPQAIQRVRTECQKVASMQLFHVPMSKTQRLEEFDQTQSQASNQVYNQLIKKEILPSHSIVKYFPILL